MFEEYKKRKTEKAKEEFLRTQQEMEELSIMNREKILAKMGTDKPQCITDMTSTNSRNIDKVELYYNKYKSCEISNIENTKWFNNIKDNIENKTASIFILHGNINDQAVKRFVIEDYLKEKLLSEVNINEICTLDYLNLNGMYLTDNNLGISDYFSARICEAAIMLKHKYENKKALIIKHPQFLFTNGNDTSVNDRTVTSVVTIQDLLSNSDFCESGNVVFILADSLGCVNKHLLTTTNNIATIEIPFPNFEDRIKMLEYLNEASDMMIENKDKLIEIANGTAGLNLNHIENIWKSSIKEGKINHDKIKEYKRDVMRKEYEDKIDIIEPDKKHNLDSYGGMEYIKDYLRKGIVKPILKGDIDMIPKGMLFMGSPGTGKSYLAKCLASETGISFAELKVAKFESKWVGETEQNLEKALLCVKSLAPCFLFIDEIDQVLQRGEGDSNNVRSSVFQIMMNFLGDPDIRGKVIVIGATNYPNKMDEALKRAGRFDVKLVFTPPMTMSDTELVLKTVLNKVNYPIAIEEYSKDFVELVKRLQGYSQAEIELVVTKALSIAKRDEESCVRAEAFLKATEYIRKADNDKIEEMTRLAIEECNDLEFIPQELMQKYSSEKNNIKKMKWDE